MTDTPHWLDGLDDEPLPEPTFVPPSVWLIRATDDEVLLDIVMRLTSGTANPRVVAAKIADVKQGEC